MRPTILWLAIGALALSSCDNASGNRKKGAEQAAAAASGFPALTGRVVDEANLLTPAEEESLESRLSAVEREVGPQFVVVTVPSLGGRAIEQYGLQLGRRWGIGDKERNDGLLLIVAPTERQVRIEVGYGLEKRVTDPFAAKVIRDQILPRFREGEFGPGIAAGSDALIGRLRSKASDEAIAKQDRVVT